MAKKATGKKATTKLEAKESRLPKAAGSGRSKKKLLSRTGITKSSRGEAKGKAKAKSQSAEVGIQSQHVDFLTYKVDQVQKFYTDLLGLKSRMVDHDGLNYLTVRTSNSSTLGFMPPHPDMASETPLPREPTLYFVVKNVDAVYAKLSERGLSFMGPPEEMPWGHRVVTTTDPEGRTVMIASKVAVKK